MTVRICHSCAATSIEAKFARKVRGQPAPKLCLDCEAPADARSPPSNPPRTRASYRAAYRHRVKQAQGDLVDLLVPPP